MDDLNSQNAGSGDGGNSGGDPNGWLTTFPEAQRGHEALAGYKTMKEFHDGHFQLWDSNKANQAKIIDLEGRLSNAVIKPSETATDEEKTAYRQSLYKELGVPDKPENYQFTKPTIPEGMPYDDAVEGWFRAIMHKNNVPQDAANAVFNEYVSMTGQYFQEAKKLQEDNIKQKVEGVKTAWGKDAALNQDLATRAAYKLADLHKDIPGFTDWITKAAIEKGPFLYVLLADIGKAAQSSKFFEGKGSGGEVVVGMNYDH